jgi:hypothetical protein
MERSALVLDADVESSAKTHLATLQEASRQSENLLRRKRDVEGLGNGAGAVQDVEQGLMARFEGHDRCSRGEEVRVGDKVSLARESEVRSLPRDAETRRAELTAPR